MEGEYLEDGEPADSAFWEYWLDEVARVKHGLSPLQIHPPGNKRKRATINNNKLITIKQGYEATLHMLYGYWKLTGSEKITDILRGGAYIERDTPANPVFWNYWLAAVEKLKKEGPLFKVWL